MGNIYFHPEGASGRRTSRRSRSRRQGFFIHEMTHVWQAQAKGRFYLPLMRHPFCRYRYRSTESVRSNAMAWSSKRKSSGTCFLAERGIQPPVCPPRIAVAVRRSSRL